MIRIYPASGGYAVFKIDGKRVYGGDGGYPLYYIEGTCIYDKNYRLVYRVDGNYIYKSMGDYPEYWIDGENIYSGNGGGAIYRIDYGDKSAERTNDSAFTGSNSSSGCEGGFHGGGASLPESSGSFVPIAGIILIVLSICVLAISGPELLTILLQPRLVLLYVVGAFIISWISFAGNGTLKGTIMGTLVLIVIMFEYFAIAGKADLGSSGIISKFIMWIILKAVSIIVMGILAIPFGVGIGAMAYGFASFYRFLHERKMLHWLFVTLGILILLVAILVRYTGVFNKTIELLKSGNYKETSQTMDEIPFSDEYATIVEEDRGIPYVDNEDNLIDYGIYKDGHGINAYEYVLPESDSRYLTRDDIANLTLRGVNYAKNEIYARYGRDFKSRELQDFFSGRQWYSVSYSLSDENDKGITGMFNPYEKENSKFLASIEKEMGTYNLQ